MIMRRRRRKGKTKKKGGEGGKGTVGEISIQVLSCKMYSKALCVTYLQLSGLSEPCLWLVHWSPPLLPLL